MVKKEYYSIIFIVLIVMQCGNEKVSANRDHISTGKIVKAFNRMDESANVVEYTNSVEVNHQGGHLQGVQWMKNGADEYVIMTGSSSTYSYYAVVRLSDKNEVISVNKILEKPYKHAGGFQIHDNYMAVGIEDNEARNKSKVHLYKIDNAEQPAQQPIAVIERTGEYERATAGCVGITKIHNKIVLVVGDWSSRHLDFYITNDQAWETKQLTFEKVYTINTEEINKEDWINKSWLSYQNINLIKDQENNLYLVGLASNENQDVADLFEIETKDLKAYKIKKVATKQFKAKRGTSFRWGAGVKYDKNEDSMRIISCTAHIDGVSILNEYR